MLDSEGCQGLDDISAPEHDSFFVKKFSELGGEQNQLHNHVVACDDKLNVVECESPHQRLDSNYEGNGVWVSESGSEEHAAKRMRISPRDGGEEIDGNLSHDLNL